MSDIEQIDRAAEAEIAEDAVMNVLLGDAMLNEMMVAAYPDGNRKERIRKLLTQITNEAFITGFRRGHTNGMGTAVKILGGEV